VNDHGAVSVVCCPLFDEGNTQNKKHDFVGAPSFRKIGGSGKILHGAQTPNDHDTEWDGRNFKIVIAERGWSRR